MEAPDELFRALVDPTRRAIYERLACEGEQTVRALTDFAGVSQPAVSKHLALLKAAKLVCCQPVGREVRYRADPRGLGPLVDWMAQYGAFWNDHLDRLESLLERMDP